MTEHFRSLILLPFKVRGLLLLALACLFVAVGGRSSAEAQPVRIGVRAGPSFGFLSDGTPPFTGGTPRINANPRLTFQAGGYLLVPLPDPLVLQSELRYLQKGGHFSQPLSERYSVERYQFSYLQGALLLRRPFPIAGPLALHVAAGLSVDRALGGVRRRNLHSAGLNAATRVSFSETDRLRRWDIGGLLEAGLGYSVDPGSQIALTLRYNPGFRSVFARSGPAASRESAPQPPFPLPSSVPTLRHDVITASLTYTLPLAYLF
jgi:hypothetical protein